LLAATYGTREARIWLLAAGAAVIETVLERVGVEIAWGSPYLSGYSWEDYSVTFAGKSSRFGISSGAELALGC
jgi:hypothetical protein